MTAAYAELQATSTCVVHLFGTLSVQQHGRIYPVPEGCKKLLAFVALQHGRVDRRYAAGSLWPEGSDDRAAGNLRSALWRLRGAGIEVLESDKATVFLRERTDTDLGTLSAWADRLIGGDATEADMSAPEWATVIELLPGWYDEWVIFERERIRQRMLHALEALSRIQCSAGRYGEAIDVAMEAVAIEPLRESAHRVLAEAHLAEGNRIEAQRSYFRYRDLVRDELGVQPTRAFREWMSECLPLPAPRVR